MRACHLDPGDAATFESCKLDFSERAKNAHFYQLHKDLLRLRREVSALRSPMDGAVLGEQALVLRFFGANSDDRLLLFNLGADLHLDTAPEPLLAPIQDRLWAVEWSSEDPLYGGCGAPSPDGPDNWRLPAESAILLKPDGANPWD